MKYIVLVITQAFLGILGYGQFSIHVDSTSGAITNISSARDKNNMNWIMSSRDSIPTWQQPYEDWGLGKVTVNGQKYSWADPKSLSIHKTSSNAVYEVQGLRIKVERNWSGTLANETYTFTNTSKNAINVSEFGIYTPYNDNYPDAKTCATNRCNTHIWPGMNSSYVNAVRMDGIGPHLGLVLTQGALKSYSIENRGKDGGGAYSSSNVRGTIVLNIADTTIPAGEEYVLQWKLFWHNDWNDFFAKARSLGFQQVEASKYVVNLGDTLVATVSSDKEQKVLKIPAETPGEQTFTIPYGKGMSTWLNYLVISKPEDLISKRVHFIVSRQQMNDVNDKRYGAYMVYDNETNEILLNAESADHDEGAERLAMGAVVAKWLQTHQDSAVYNSLMKYTQFVRQRLQTPDYKVFSNATKTSRHRGYNYPFVAALYLETYQLTGNRSYLMDYYGTLRRFYKEFGHEFYALCIEPRRGLNALLKEGLKAEYDTLLNDFKLMGDHNIANGIFYPKHEVNYEQSIVGPSVAFLCELYLVTRDEKYLHGAEAQMPSLEAFGGKQPDVHLNEIGIRHWDGYWFGKREMWGDVMPHYWSTTSADAFFLYYECTGKKRYREMALKILDNNFLNFKEDGRASCAYIYPATVDGIQGKFYDPYANDQDWALYFYLKVHSASGNF
ncbi:hypothetical protein QTN47_04960 [Danxiaibacter flavus]|uniref:Six-hairpin glycosidase n=1 Tax=Danxiaibacter flavus TaxID=3049108 RepID=A0ABV3ZBC2_9BACT|nr:hypothetical protein QNM32_04960 [Chitinophagaceae bacterium DXS]